MKRTGSLPTSSTTSRSVTNSPARFDIFTGAPPRNSFTSCTILTSRSAVGALVIGRTKQRLLAILPILDRRPLRRRQAPLVDVAGVPQRGDRLAHLIARPLEERTLGEKHVLHDFEREQIVTDLAHHHVDGAMAYQG